MILAVTGIILVAFIVYGLYKASALKYIHIVKTISINARQEEVFDMVKYLGNFPKWSPFLAQDPSQKYEIKGEDGKVGARYYWNGNGGKDQGYQEIVSIEPYRFISLRCDIQKPFVATPTFDYSFKETNGRIEVIQDFKLNSGLMDAFFMWLFGAKSKMEATNQQGLELLRKANEKK